MGLNLKIELCSKFRCCLGTSNVQAWGNLIGLNYIHIRSNFYHKITPNILYFKYKVNRIHLESSYCVCLVLTCRKWRKMKKIEENFSVRTHGLRYGRTKYLDGFLDVRQLKKRYNKLCIKIRANALWSHRKKIRAQCEWPGCSGAERRKRESELKTAITFNS